MMNKKQSRKLISKLSAAMGSWHPSQQLLALRAMGALHGDLRDWPAITNGSPERALAILEGREEGLEK